MNIIASVVPGIDLALSRQTWQSLEAEHLRAYSLAFFGGGVPDKRCAEASFNLAVKEARMFKVFEATLKVRSN